MKKLFVQHIWHFERPITMYGIFNSLEHLQYFLAYEQRKHKIVITYTIKKEL